MTGIPIVGTLVGGTGEMLRADGSLGRSARRMPRRTSSAIRSVLATPPTRGVGP